MIERFHPATDADAASILAVQALRANFARRKNIPLADFIARQHWDATTRAIVGTIMKRGVGGSDLADATGRAKVGNYVVPSLKTRSALDAALALGAVKVPRDTRLLVSGDAVVAAAKTNGRAVRVYKQALDATALGGFTFGAISVAANELLEGADSDMEALIARNIERGIDDAVNAALFDGGAASALRPAALNNGATTIHSSGTPATDLSAAFRELSDKGSNCQNLVIYGHTRTSGNMATLLGSGGAPSYPEMTPFGGRAAGVPFVATQAVVNGGSPTSTELIVIDASDLIVVDDGAVVSISNETTLELSDAPTGNSVTPTAASQEIVSMFENDSTAVKATRRCNWKLCRGLVVVVDGVSY